MNQMNRRTFLTATSIACLTGSAIVSTQSFAQPQLPISDLIIEGPRGLYKLRVELAESRQELMEGLMFRRSLPRDGGMLFNYKKSIPVTMWMRNTFIPLDMIFIRSSGLISHIAQSVEPQSKRQIESLESVQAVLEVNAGVTKALGITSGHKVFHPIFGNYPPRKR